MANAKTSSRQERKTRVRIFLAGAVHSHHSTRQVSQTYRVKLADLVKEYGGTVVDPMSLLSRTAMDRTHPDMGAQIFKGILQTVRSCDLLIAYLPIASMGAAIEMHAATVAGIPVVAVTKLGTRWSVLAVTTLVVPSVSELANRVRESGDFTHFVAQLRATHNVRSRAQ